MSLPQLRPRQKLGKYRLLKRLGSGTFAEVWKAQDTLEHASVALKIPHPHLYTKETEESYLNEVRLIRRLDHPNVLPVKSADIIHGLLVISHPLGEKTLHELLGQRLPLQRILDLFDQVLQALAHAHARRIIHCDVKPENVLIFPGDQVKICDFGIAKLTHFTHVSGSGSGTVGYLAPEQALGFPSVRSDVFSAGLLLYQLLTGHLPRWPFHWPPPGAEKLPRRVGPAMLALLEKSLALDSKKRYRDAGAMLRAFRIARTEALRRQRKEQRRRKTVAEGDTKARWQRLRERQCLRQYGRALELSTRCSRCEGPVSETMFWCPWCGAPRPRHDGPSTFPARCPRCRRGRKLDWRFCGFCYGSGFPEVSARKFTDRRYVARCARPRCPGRWLMPFLRYCPWCRTKVRRAWKIEGVEDRCAQCRWSILKEYWDFCAWCGASQRT